MGQSPLFFSNASTMPEIPLPDLQAIEQPPHHTPVTLNYELAELWDVLHRFCAMVNQASLNRRKLSDQTLLETMTSVMYRLLHISSTSESIDEVIVLGMMSFCVSVFLTWSHLRMPFELLQRKHVRSIDCLMQTLRSSSHPETLLWSLLIYVGAFSPLVGVDRLQVRAWLVEVAATCGLTTWSGMRTAMKDFLWIDIVHTSVAQKFAEEVFSLTAAVDTSR